MSESDKWSRWVLENRFVGGNAPAAQFWRYGLKRIADRLFDKAALGEGKVLLDVGSGDGLIAFHALSQLGESGKVIVSDISEPLLEHARKMAEEAGVSSRCTFVKATAEDLSPLEDESVDAVTTRSVLIYVDDKPRAFKEFLRVLKPSGRIALFEPIADYRMTDDNEFWRRATWATSFQEIAPIMDLLKRLRDYYAQIRRVNEAMTNFNERDLVRMCVEAGFAAVHTQLDINAFKSPPTLWDVVMNSAGNPLIPSQAEVLKEIFTEDERALYEQHMRPVVERGGQLSRTQSSYTWAIKAPVPIDPWGRGG